jgi:hypothetical protein
VSEAQEIEEVRAVEETGPSASRMTGRLRVELGGMECELRNAWWHDSQQWNRKELKESEEVGGVEKLSKSGKL